MTEVPGKRELLIAVPDGADAQVIDGVRVLEEPEHLPDPSLVFL